MATRANKTIYRTAQQIIAASLILPALTWAECYQESVTMNSAQAQIREIADYQKFVKTVNNQQICSVMFRAKINNRWYDVRGESSGSVTDSTDQICSQALHVGRTTILEKITGSAVQSSQTLYCNDFDTPKIRKGLKKFDTFKVSELKPVPNAQPFEHKGTICQHFLESDMDPKTNNLMQWQIVGCVIRDEWTVVDKF